MGGSVERNMYNEAKIKQEKVVSQVEKNVLFDDIAELLIRINVLIEKNTAQTD